MKVEWKTVQSDAADMNAACIPIGKVFTCKGIHAADHPILRVFEGLVDLVDPESTWSFSSCAEAPVLTNIRYLNVTLVVESDYDRRSDP